MAMIAITASTSTTARAMPMTRPSSARNDHGLCGATLTDARAGGVDTCRGYPIASISLAVVEAAVCGAKHFVDCAQAVEMTGLRSRGADAHRDADLSGARGNWLGAHGATDAGRHRFRSFKPGIRQHHDELLAAGAGDPIAFPKHRSHANDESAQHFVAHGVSEAVVDALEVIQVAHQQRQGTARAGTVTALAFQ